MLFNLTYQLKIVILWSSTMRKYIFLAIKKAYHPHRRPFSGNTHDRWGTVHVTNGATDVILWRHGLPKATCFCLAEMCETHLRYMCNKKITVYRVVLFNFMFPSEWDGTSCPGHSVWVELFQQTVTPALPSLKAPV